jgi:hypothetical protein
LFWKLKILRKKDNLNLYYWMILYDLYMVRQLFKKDKFKLFYNNHYINLYKFLSKYISLR